MRAIPYHRWPRAEAEPAPWPIQTTPHSTAALYGEITFADGKVEQSNFHDYQILRFNEAPQIEVVIVNSGEAMGGAGEPGTSPIAPAVANAIYAATGKCVRRLPIAKNLV